MIKTGGQKLAKFRGECNSDLSHSTNPNGKICYRHCFVVELQNTNILYYSMGRYTIEWYKKFVFGSSANICLQIGR